MKENKLLVEIRKNTDEEIKREVDLSFDVANALINILASKGMSQKELASMLKKKESEISKWLSGRHNFTLRTIAKIESALGEKLIHVATKDTRIIGGMHQFRKSGVYSRNTYVVFKERSLTVSSSGKIEASYNKVIQ